MESGTRLLVLGTRDFGELHAVLLHCFYLVPMEASTDSNFAKPIIFKLLLVTSSNDLDASGSTRTELNPLPPVIRHGCRSLCLSHRLKLGFRHVASMASCGLF